MSIKNIKERYSSKNDPLWLAVGDALAHLGTLITSYSVLNDKPGWAMTSLIATWLGFTIPKFTKAKNATV